MTLFEPFGLNKFLAPLLGTENFLGGSTRVGHTLITSYSLVITSFWRRCRG